MVYELKFNLLLLLLLLFSAGATYIVDGDWHMFWEIGSSFCFFIIGATICGLMVNYDTFYLGRNYGRVLFVISASQGLALLIENIFDK